MCGIYGAIGENYKEIEHPFKKALQHRGSDDSGFFTDDKFKISLGHNRLSIIDLSANGHQPMTEESGRYTIVFNGEIYNYNELRISLKKQGFHFFSNSDTEVVLKGFIHWKEKCLNKLRGMFAFAIYDNLMHKLFLARDRVGIKPLIYYIDSSQFLFASELKPFLKSDFISKKINSSAVEEYFLFGSVKQPNTILEKVRFLMPGHFIYVDKNLKMRAEQYYNLLDNININTEISDYDDAVKLIKNEFKEATKYHMISDVDVGAFLSGGVDSTAVVSLMQKFSRKKIHTFSIGFKKQDEVIDETDVAARSAQIIGTNHQNIIIDDNYVAEIFPDFIDSIDQPSFDGINTYIISKETSKHIKVALSGLGGDEIFAGYPHFKSIHDYSNCKESITSFLGKKINDIKNNRFTNQYKYYGKSPEYSLYDQRTITKKIDSVLNPNYYTKRRELDTSIGLSTIQRLSISELKGYLLNTLLRDCDTVSMAHSQEVRPILLDHKLIENVLSLPDEFKLKNGRLKSLFIDASKDIIPDEVWKRKKTGFVMPYAKWLNGVLNEKFKEELNSLNNNQNVFNKTYLINLNKRIINKTLVSKDWLTFIFVSWINTFKLNF